MDRLISLEQRTVCASPKRDSRPPTDLATFTDEPSLASPSSSNSLLSPLNQLLKQEQQSAVRPENTYHFGSTEDWMNWDEPSDAALSPTYSSIESSSRTPKLNVKSETQGNAMGLGGFSSSRMAVEPEFIEDPVSPEPFFPTPIDMASAIMPTSTVPSRAGLYSSPFSWSRPTVSQMHSFDAGLSSQQESPFHSAADRSNQSYESDAISPTSTSSVGASENKRRKRNSSAEPEVDGEEEEGVSPATSRSPPKKTAHNVTEKRYRTNLNDKIVALRDSVPALRVVSAKNFTGDETPEDLQGLTPAHKLNKATILSKATEYIAHLEKQNGQMVRENAALKARVDAFEILLLTRQPQQQRRRQLGGEGQH